MIKKKKPCKSLIYRTFLKGARTDSIRRLLMNAIANGIDLDDVYNVIEDGNLILGSAIRHTKC